ncbi:MAG: hypothetical protein IJ608_02815 [Lachnospiraceae bacterium]|nr:hypothetical protein [Lachnospiraceae bacterium]
MTFKEQVQLDNAKVFLNFDEFAIKETINGKEMLCIVDNNEMIERETRYNHKGEYSDGVFAKQLLIYVLSEEFGALPAIGRVLTFGKKQYRITDAIDEDGIYSLSLEANKTTV